MKQILRFSLLLFTGFTVPLLAQRYTHLSDMPDMRFEIMQQTQVGNPPVVVIVQKDPPPLAPIVVPAPQPNVREAWEEHQRREEEKALARQQAATDRARNTDIKQVANQNRTFFVKSDTFLVSREQLVGEVRNRDGFKDLQLVEVDNFNAAEVVLTVNHIPFTFDYTYSAVDKKTSVILAAGKITAGVGYIAAMELAHAFVKDMAKLREQEKQKVLEKAAPAQSGTKPDEKKPEVETTVPKN